MTAAGAGSRGARIRRSPDRTEQAPDRTEQAPDRTEQAPDRTEQAPDRTEQARRLAKVVLTEPFQSRTWSELGFYVLSGLVGLLGAFFVAGVFFVGLLSAVVFIGVVILAGGLRGARGLGAWERALARQLLGETIEDPEPFHARRGLIGWLSASYRDRAAWRALAYIVAKVPLVLFGAWFALSVWLQAVFSLLQSVAGGQAVLRIPGFLGQLYRPGYAGNPLGAGVRVLLFLVGVLLLFVAPWTMRVVVNLDRLLIRTLLGPDAMTTRVRALEQSRAQTVDVAAATLRRIERDLHDGTQAQLVALAMRLGQVKEKLADGDHADFESIRRLVDEAHRGAKEAIVELRDLARGIHPPVLDTGLEGALATLSARSSVPTEIQVTMHSRPTPAIEAISYFCVAELLANVAQHAHASKASISCTEHGPWLRIVVRDDGRGGATLNRVGNTSSGLAGLSDRVTSVDGHLSIASPVGGPTVITIDLPVNASESW